MRTYIAMTGKQRFAGGWHHCIGWGISKVTDNRSLVVKVVSIRPGEKHGRIVSEVTADGIRQITEGRLIAAHKLRSGSDG